MLDVVYESRDERQIHEELRRLDPQLFLVRQRDPHGRDFYEVRFWVGSEHEPLCAVDWRLPDDTPKPLSSGIVYEVQRLMAAGPITVEAINRKNAELRERNERRAHEGYQEIAEDFERHRGIGNFMVVPRSQALRLSRDRIRRRGGKA